MPSWLVPNQTVIEDLFENDRETFYDLVWLEAHSIDFGQSKDFRSLKMRSLNTLAMHFSFMPPEEIGKALSQVMRGSNKLNSFLSDIFPTTANGCLTLSEIRDRLGVFFQHGALELKVKTIKDLNMILVPFISDFDETIKSGLFRDFESVSDLREGIVSRLVIFLLSHSNFTEKKMKNLLNSSFTGQQAKFLRENLGELNMAEINFLYDNYFNFKEKSEISENELFADDEIENDEKDSGLLDFDQK